MSEVKRAVLLVGSPREKSSSGSIGTYLMEKIQSHGGWEYEIIRVHISVRDEEEIGKLLEATDQADLVVLSFPLYVDCLPAPVTEALELIENHRRAHRPGKKQRFLAITNCGFPESEHTAVCLDICRQFAFEAGFEYAGGLGMGMGEMIQGKELDKAGGVVWSVRKALNEVAEALVEGKPIPQESKDLFGRRLIPIFWYTYAGSQGWKSRAKKYGTINKLRDRPYAERG
jgi:hypothetical protein